MARVQEAEMAVVGEARNEVTEARAAREAAERDRSEACTDAWAAWLEVSKAREALAAAEQQLAVAAEGDKAAIEAEIAQSQKFLSYSFEDLTAIIESDRASIGAEMEMKMMSANSVTKHLELRVDKLKGKLDTALNDMHEAQLNNIQLQDVVDQARSLQTIADLRAKTMSAEVHEAYKEVSEARAAREAAERDRSEACTEAQAALAVAEKEREAAIEAAIAHSCSFEELRAIVESDRAAIEADDAQTYSFEDLKAIVESDRAAIKAENAQSQKFLSYSFEELKAIEEANLAFKEQNEKLKRSVDDSN